MHSENKENCCKPHNGGKSIIIILLLVSILTSIASGYFFSSTGGSGAKDIANEVMKQYMEAEYMKAGGKETYELLSEAQKLQTASQLPQIREFIAKQKGTTAGTTAPETPVAPKKLTLDEIANIKKTAYIEGNKDALITMIEYSDLECPFCIRQFKDGTIDKVHARYGDKVNSALKSFRAVPHENAEIEANASLCAGDLGGQATYTAYYKAIFARNDGSNNGRGFSRDALVPLAKELKLDTKKFQACMDSKKNIARFDADTVEGRKLGVEGTPGTVIINNKTGEYELVAGAYPVSKFNEIIDRLLESK